MKYGWGVFDGDDEGGVMVAAGDPRLTEQDALNEALAALEQLIVIGHPDPLRLQAIVFDEYGIPQGSVRPRMLTSAN